MNNELLRFKILNKPSHIDGTGAFAGEQILRSKKVGELSGEIISQRKARQRAATVKRIAMIEFGNGKALDASVKSNALRYINHSCCPNVFMRVRYPRVEFYALKPIKKGEELTCNYGLTHHDGKLKCVCGSKNCKGFI